MDQWWLRSRVLYETIVKQPQEAIKISYLINIIIPEMYKFLANNKKLVNKPKQFENGWAEIEKQSNVEMELQLMETKKDAAKPIEIIQKLHFDQLNELSKSTDKEAEEYAKIVGELLNNKSARLNLLQLLTKEDAKHFLELIGAKYDEKEMNSAEQNVNNNKNDGKRNKKKKEKKRGGKKSVGGQSTELSPSTTNLISNKNQSDQNSQSVTDLDDQGKSKELSLSVTNLISNENQSDHVTDLDDQNRINEPPSIKKPQNKPTKDILEQNVEQIESNKMSKSVERLKNVGRGGDNSLDTITPVPNQTANDTFPDFLNNEKQIGAEKDKQILLKNSNENEAAKQQQIKAEKGKEHEKAKLVLLKRAATEQRYNSLTEFCDDLILLERYKIFMLNNYGSSKSGDHLLLSLGAFVNEIEHRIKLVAELSSNKLNYFLMDNFLEKNKSQNLIEKWAQMKRELLSEAKLESKDQLWKVEQKLYEMLRETLVFIDGEGQLIGFKNTENFENKNLNIQIQMNNVLTALIEDQKLRQIWANYGTEYITEKLNCLLQIHMGNICFEELLKTQKKIMEQIEIDKELFEKPGPIAQKEYSLIPNFPIIAQQLFFAKREVAIKNSVQYFEDYLTTFLYGSFGMGKIYEQKIIGAISKIEKIVDNWSNKQAYLLATGSILLNCQTIGSDVNLVCLTPGEWLKVSHFMGDDRNAKCLHNKCITTNEEQTSNNANNNNNASSLFCKICEHESTTNLIKIESESIMLIRFNFEGIEFDISLVEMPKMRHLPQEVNDQTLDNLLKQFNWSKSSGNMIRTLSSYRSTLYIFNLFKDGMTQPNTSLSNDANHSSIYYKKRSFAVLLVTLKLWAKNNYIYSNKMGFLNGITLAIMVTKIMLLFPNATTAFLIEKFFLYYSTRVKHFPIQITRINIIDQDLITNGKFTLLNLKEMEMPVITPTVPVQNATRLVTLPNARVIRHEMIKALNKVKAMKNKEFDLGELLISSPFTQKYETFVVINCMAEQKEMADEFCAFVEWRMRLQITYDIDKIDGKNIETHLHPNVYSENCNLPNKFVPTTIFSPLYCKVWLLGIRNSSINDQEALNGKAQNFDMAIKKKFYFVYSKKKSEGQRPKMINWSVDELGKALKIELKSVLVNRETIVGGL